MHRRFLPLICAALLSATNPSLAQDTDTDGIKIYRSLVSAAKLHAESEKANLQAFDEKEALKLSQDAIGRQLGDYTFLNRGGRTVRLSEYRGKPLVIDMIYTHCPNVCATKTRNLEALKLSRDALGADSFGVLTIGFDTENDTPEAMDDFAGRMDVKLPNWEFVSADPDTIKKLSRDLGFVFSPSPNGGFDHIVQTTFVDGRGVIRQQIYGDDFNYKTLLEPLKKMIYNIKATDSLSDFKATEPGFAGVVKSVRLFCTVYDTKTGRYVIDYSRIYGLGFDGLVLLILAWWIVSVFRRRPERDCRHD